MTLDLEAKAARCRLLVSLVAADDVVTVEEQRFLERTLQHLGMSEDDFTAAMQVVDAERASAVAAGLPAEERRTVLQELIDAAHADGHLHSAESAFIERVADALGLADAVPPPSKE